MSLTSAFARGVDAVEFDVQLTSDGEAILAHDPHLERMTSGKGCVSEVLFKDMAKLRLRDGQGRVYPFLRVNTLKETLATLKLFDSPKRPFLADIHIKVYDGFRGDMVGLTNEGCPVTDYERLVDRVLRDVSDAGLLDRVVFTAFDTRALNRIRMILPKQRVGLLTWMAPGLAIREAAYWRYDYVALGKELFSASAAEHAREEGLGVLVWSPSTRDSLVETAVDGAQGWITDNIPDAVNTRDRIQRVLEVMNRGTR